MDALHRKYIRTKTSYNLVSAWLKNKFEIVRKLSPTAARTDVLVYYMHNFLALNMQYTESEPEPIWM